MRNLQFDTAINNMSQGLCFFDAEQRLIVCNDRYVEMYDLPPDRVGPGTPLAEIVDMRFDAGSCPRDVEGGISPWRDAGRDLGQAHRQHRRTAQRPHSSRSVIARCPISGWVATHEDITEQRRSEVEDRIHGPPRRADRSRQPCAAERAARTGAGARIHATKWWRCTISISISSRRSTTPSAIPPATSCCKMVADRLRGLVRETDTIARMGGDEFVIVQAPIDDPADATSLAQRILEAGRRALRYRRPAGA